MFAIKKKVKFGNYTLSFETGALARQANAAVLVDIDGTSILVTLVSKPSDADFCNLRVDYIEKFYASGKVPGGFYKREGGPSKRETLVARLIDRPLRPLFPAGFYDEVQIVATLLSLNPEVDPDIPAMIGASLVCVLSGMPISEPMAAARVGFINNTFVLNPNISEQKSSQLDLVVAGTSSSVLMVEAGALELSEEIVSQAIAFGHEQFKPVIAAIEEFGLAAGKPKMQWQAAEQDLELRAQIENNYATKISAAYQIRQKAERKEELDKIRKELLEQYVIEVKEDTLEEGDVDESDVIVDNELKIRNLKALDLEVRSIVEDIERSIVRGTILDGKPRIDGRSTTDIRDIHVATGLLQRTHGSALFTRGETQALVVATLGTSKDAQMIDSPFGETKEPFIFQYNFPPFSTGEIGLVGRPKRREIGHGKLAERGVQAVLPDLTKYPYVLRVVSEILESNGSSSMASVCGASLALMDAGVPLKAPVAGIAMGLIKEGDKFAILSDILGDEDHLGDMDFKVAGTEGGITALQMDIKISGITKDIMDRALEQARLGRLHILGKMNEVLPCSRNDISEYAPRIITLKIHQDKIKDVIGKGGATIRGILETVPGSSIDIEEDGNIKIAAPTKVLADTLKKQIEDLTTEVEVGKIYEGKVVRITEFGAFVNILPNKDGLLHISQISRQRINEVRDVLHEGQMVHVKVIEIDRQGRFKLSMKEVMAEEAGG